jgi:hypothetical protein
MIPYSAAPLTDHQRAEALRVMSESAALERHNYFTMLSAERTAALRQIRQEPQREAQLSLVAETYDRALALLDQCWPQPF